MLESGYKCMGTKRKQGREDKMQQNSEQLSYVYLLRDDYTQI